MCVNVFVVLVVVVAVVCGSYITMETVALSCREDVDAGESTALAAERSNNKIREDSRWADSWLYVNQGIMEMFPL